MLQKAIPFLLTHTYEWVMSHIQRCHVNTHHTYIVDAWVMSHMNVSCHTHEWVMSHIRMSHVTHTKEYRRTHEWVMSHIRMSYINTHRTYIVADVVHFASIYEHTDVCVQKRRNNLEIPNICTYTGKLHVYVCIHIHVFMSIHFTYACMYIHTWQYVNIHIWVHMCIYIHVYWHIRAHLCLRLEVQEKTSIHK